MAGIVSLSAFQRRAVSLDWHEAVAVIAELAGSMIASGATRVPSPETVFVAADGALEVRGGHTLDGLPVPQLAALLESLLASARVPPELAQLIADHRAAKPGHLTVRDFGDALAFFEPPGRREILSAIVERTADVDGDARAEEELQRLAARARDAEDQPVGPKDAATPSRRRIARLAGAAVALGAVAGGGLALFATLSKPGAVAGSVQAQVKTLVKAGLEAVGVATPDAPPAPVPAPAAAPAPHARRPTRVSRNPEAVQFTVEVRDLGGHLPEAPPPDEPPVPESPLDSTIYNADADGIIPAVLMRPHLPSRPPSTVPAEELGVLELVVSQVGAVDHVRLISRENRYQDRMIVAAAKTWRFQPATRDGAAVRSRVRIRVTL